MKRKTLILLIIITLIAGFLRLWQLGNVPISPDWDEAALGYNAYSILHTGRDEYGKLFPVVLQSFNDYKPAFYSYLIIPFIVLFNLTVFSIRLPSAVFGIATVVAVFFLVKELFRRDDIALLSSFLLAISPWHIQFSRVAFETNVGLALNMFMVLAFLKGLKSPWLLSLSVIFADLSIYTYQSEKVFTPLLFLALVIIYHRQLLVIPKKYLISAVIVGLIVILPMISYSLTNKQAFARAEGVSIFAQPSNDVQRSIRYSLYDRQQHDVIGVLLNNRRFAYIEEIISNYLIHFNPNWLFITGDISRHHAPGMGLLYIWEIPFILIGIYQLIFGTYDKKTKALVFAWFLIAPIPASVTTGVPHAVRTLNFLPTYQIFTAIGILWFAALVNRLHKFPRLRFAALGMTTIVVVIFIINISYFLNQYFVQQNYFNAFDWQYGYAQAVAEMQQISPSYKKIIISDAAPMDQSYIFFLFYLKYPPAEYQQENGSLFRIDHAFGKFTFKGFSSQNEPKSSNTLYIGSPHDFPASINALHTIHYPDGQPDILFVQGKS